MMVEPNKSSTMRLAVLFTLVAGVAQADDEPKAGEPAVPAPPTDATKPEEPAAKPTPAAATAATSEPAPKKVTIVVANGMLQRHGLSPDLTISAGVRLWDSDSAKSRWWAGRLRAGAVLYAEPTFLAFGIAGQFGPLDSASLGVEAQFLNLWSGLSLQGGVFPIDSISGTTLEASIGYGVFAIEYQRRVSGARQGDQTLCFMLQVPLGILRVALQEPEGVIHLPNATARR